MFRALKKQRASTSRLRKGRSEVRPQLEALEDRWMPSLTPVNPCPVMPYNPCPVMPYVGRVVWQVGPFSPTLLNHSLDCVSPIIFREVGPFSPTPLNPCAAYPSGAVAAAPSAPWLTATAVSSSQVNLTWTSVAGASGYLVDEWINGAWQQIDNLSGGSTGCAVTGLSAATTYYFDVAACNSDGTTWANWQAVTTLKENPPAAPSFAATVITSSQVTLAWDRVAGANGYLVDEWINGALKQFNLPGSCTRFTATGLSAATTYYFDVAACNSAGTTWANWQPFTTLRGGPPTAPSFVASDVSASQINLSWSSVAGASGYLVDEVVNGALKQLSLPGGCTSCVLTGLSNSTIYYFDVAAFNAASTTWAPSQRVVTIDHPDPGNGNTYSPVSGTLFGNGPLYLDVQQGGVGDCWLEASLAAVAAREPSVIRSMFTYMGTEIENGAKVGLYSVRLYDNSGEAHNIIVDTELPDGGSLYDRPDNGVLWVALAEKAYAQANGLNLVTTGAGDEGSDSYNALNGGEPSWALCMPSRVGQPATSTSTPATSPRTGWRAIRSSSSRALTMPAPISWGAPKESTPMPWWATTRRAANPSRCSIRGEAAPLRSGAPLTIRSMASSQPARLFCPKTSAGSPSVLGPSLSRGAWSAPSGRRYSR